MSSMTSHLEDEPTAARMILRELPRWRVALVLLGAGLLVAEAHLPSGILGVAGGLALAGGAALAISGAGAALAVVLAGVVAALAVSGLWLGIATRKALATRQLRSSSGREALSGRMGVVRNWAGAGGQEAVADDRRTTRATPGPPALGQVVYAATRAIATALSKAAGLSTTA